MLIQGESWEDFSVQMRIYCSETRQWNDPVLLSFEHEVHSNIIAFNRKLYWHNIEMLLLMILSVMRLFSLMDLIPKDSTLKNCGRIASVSLGMCQGYLRVMKHVNFLPSGEDDVNYLTVWELGTETRRLNVKHKMFLVPQPETVVFLRAWTEILLGSKRMKVYEGPRTLAFHPNREDLVYLLIGQQIITCEITSGKLEGLPDKMLFTTKLPSIREVFTILLPWWPTPGLLWFGCQITNWQKIEFMNYLFMFYHQIFSLGVDMAPCKCISNSLHLASFGMVW